MVSICVCLHAMVHMWKQADNLGESVLSLHHADPEDQTQIIRFGCKCLPLLTHLASTLHILIKKKIFE